MAFMTFHVLGMSSSQLTHIFQRGRYTTNQINVNTIKCNPVINGELMDH